LGASLGELSPLLHAAGDALLRPAGEEARSDEFRDLIIGWERGLSNNAALLGILAADGIGDLARQSDVHAEEVEEADVRLLVAAVEANSEVVGSGFAAKLLVEAKALLFRRAANAVGGIKVQGVGAQVASAPHEVVSLVDLVHLGKEVKSESS